jgi:hypothetical protein
MKLQASVLEAVKALGVRGSRASLAAEAIDVPCRAPVGAAVGGFPIGGTPTPCIAEQVARNRAQFDYIVKNNLNTRAGLAAAYAKSFKVDMPVGSIAVKGDWIPLPALLRWITARRYRQYQEALLHPDRRFRGIRSSVVARQRPPESNWVTGHLRASDEPGPL